MKRLLVTAVAAGAGLIAMAVAPLTAQARPTAPTAHTAPAVAAPSLTWTACTDPGLDGLQCASLKVPLDYSHPNGTQITLALSRATHTGTTGYQGPLLVNPGGPGGTGRDFAGRVADGLPASLRASYDVIGFDPRGVGGSNPALSCVADYFLPVRPDYVPHSIKDEAGWLKKSAGYAKACGQKYGSVLSHLKTTDAVKDMDRIRVALGAKQINYYGASYGTYLGSVYATMFPKNVRRMVLDSNVRPSGVWYDDNIDQDYAFDRNINVLFKWIAKYDSTYHLGTTQKQVHDFYYATRAKLRKAPAGGTVGPDELDDTYQVAGYISLGNYWPYLASALAAYKTGNGAPLAAAYNLLGLVTDDNGYAIYNAVQCSDTQWPRNWAKWDRDTRKVYKKAPFIAWSNAWYNAPCVFWPARAGKPVNVGHAKGLPKILLFQATLDAATPYAGGVEMNKRLAGSRLVIEDGGLTHGIVQRGNACIDDKFNAFLTNGALPSNRTHCDALPLPVPPGASARTTASPQFPPIIR